MDEIETTNNDMKVEKVSLSDIREMREREELIELVKSLKQDSSFKEMCRKYSEKNNK